MHYGLELVFNYLDELVEKKEENNKRQTVGYKRKSEK